MADQRRMVHAKILENKNFGMLSPNAKVLYLFLIILADDDGRLKANSVALRGRVFAFDENVTDKDVRNYINEVVKKRLVVWYKVDDEYFIQHPNWDRYQILRKDRKKESVIPPPNVNQMSTKRGRKEVSNQVSNKREQKPEASISFLQKIPKEVVDEFSIRFKCDPSQVQSKANSLHDYCDSKGKVYKNYKSLLSNALRSDFGERPEKGKKPVFKVIDGIAKMVGYE